VTRQPAARRRSRFALFAAGLAVTAGLGIIVAGGRAAASAAPGDVDHAASGLGVPLTGSVANSTTTWATVSMGKKNGQFDLFSELFSFNVATGRFALVTPPGVASNGGLMIAQAGVGSSALIGFGVSQDLEFSPLALSNDDGRTWSPGGLAESLAPVPSAVGFNEHGDALALVGGATQAVLERSGGLTDWKTDVSRASLAATPAGKRCEVASLEGVAVASSGSAVVGASCRAAAVPGIFIRAGASWRLATVPVPEVLKSDAFSVLRLGPSSALLGAVGRATTVVAAWQTGATGQWLLSPSLTIPSSGELLATGAGPGGRQFVLVRHAGTERAEVIAGPSAHWETLAAVPSRTATIAFLPNGQVDALSVDDTSLSVWHLGADGKGWAKVQAVTVPLAFGSSA
jgi:hypothetical protein